MHAYLTADITVGNTSGWSHYYSSTVDSYAYYSREHTTGSTVPKRIRGALIYQTRV